jgi:hypothetical protein
MCRKPRKVIVGHDHHAFAGRDGVGQEGGGLIDVQQAGGRAQGGQFAGQFFRVGQPPRGEQARQHRVDAALAQHFGCAEWIRTDSNACHAVNLAKYGGAEWRTTRKG